MRARCSGRRQQPLLGRVLRCLSEGRLYIVHPAQWMVANDRELMFSSLWAKSGPVTAGKRACIAGLEARAERNSTARRSAMASGSSKCWRYLRLTDTFARSVLRGCSTPSETPSRLDSQGLAVPATTIDAAYCWHLARTGSRQYTRIFPLRDR